MTKQSTKDFFKEYFSKEETKKQLFKPNVEEDLNRLHNVSLTEGQMSTILYILEGYIDPTNDNSYDPDCREDIDRIFAELQSVTDNYYSQQERINEQLQWYDLA